jgi:hypothetical protein
MGALFLQFGGSLTTRIVAWQFLPGKSIRLLQAVAGRQIGILGTIRGNRTVTDTEVDTCRPHIEAVGALISSLQTRCSFKYICNVRLGFNTHWTLVQNYPEASICVPIGKTTNAPLTEMSGHVELSAESNRYSV